MKLIVSGFIILVMGLLSCKTPSKISGTYKVENSQLMLQEITLNKDKTFVESIGGDVCGDHFYFGNYQLKNNKIILDPVSFHYIEYSDKNDTIFYNYDPFYKKKGLFIVENEKAPYQEVQIYINEKLLGSTNSQGFIELPENMNTGDSLKIHFADLVRKSFLVRGQKFNQVFIILYDSSLEPCANFYFKRNFRITSNGHIRVLNNGSNTKKDGVYFKKYQ